ncbi:MAG: hypothetical protein IT423_04590 [Pirellulaceae bacterium]|nr:hypothetical protein [Pirellulaceae bacterium]
MMKDSHNKADASTSRMGNSVQASPDGNPIQAAACAQDANDQAGQGQLLGDTIASKPPVPAGPRKDARVFTDWIRSVVEGKAGIPDELLNKLRRLLRQQLKKHNLWQHCVDSKTFEDHLHECFMFVFYGRGNKNKQFGYFINQVIEHGMSIDALVHQRVKFYMQDVHCALFPQHAAVYKNLRDAIQIAVEVRDVTKKDICRRRVRRDTPTLSANQLRKHVISCPFWQAAALTIRKRGVKPTELASEAVLEMIRIGMTPFLFDDLLASVIEASDSKMQASESNHEHRVSNFEMDAAEKSEWTRQIEYEEFAEELLKLIERESRGNEKMQIVLKTLIEQIRQNNSATVSEMAESIGLSRQLWNYYVVRAREIVVNRLRSPDEAAELLADEEE